MTRLLTVRLADGALQLAEHPAIVLAESGSAVDAFRLLRSRLPARPGNPELILEVGAPHLQRRTLAELPAVNQRALNALIAHSRSRYFRQNGHPLVSAATWEGPLGSAPRQAVAFAMEETLAESLVEGAAAAGLRLRDIRPAEETAARLSLLPVAEQARRRRAGWVAAAWCAGAVAGVVLIGLLGSLLWWQRRADRSESVLARLATPRAALQAARSALDSAGSMVVTLTREDSLRGALAERLATVVGRLPDGAYLHALELNMDGRGRLTGRARAAHLLPAAFPGATLVGSAIADTAGWAPFTLELIPGRTP